MKGPFIVKKYKVGEAAAILDVSVATLQRWDREGKLKAERSATNRRYYTQEQLNEYLGAASNDGRINVIYARVSAAWASDDLAKQENFLLDYCNANGITVSENMSDIGSGLNFNRPEWNQLLQKVEDREVNKIYVTHKDRFVRLAFDWFANFCKRHGSEIVVINNPATSPSQELVDDLVSIINLFSSRLPGLRRYKAEIKSDQELEAAKQVADAEVKQAEKAKKTYAVRKGRQPGIYYSWPEAEKQVNGFPGAEYKSFSRESDALNYLKLDPADPQNAVKQEPEYDKKDYSAVIYTGGACRSTGTRKGGHVQDSDKAAWAYMIEHDGKQLADSAGRLGATNNEMEMTAFLESLKKLEQLGLTQQSLLFVLNSQYVIKSVSDTKDGPAWMKSWKKRDWKTANGKPVANQELWQDIDRELAKFDSSKLKFAWLRSTVSDAGRDFVDSLLIKRMDE